MGTFRTLEFCMAFIVVAEAETALVFLRYLIAEIRRYGFERFRLQAAAAIFTRSIGNAIVLTWVWYYFNVRTGDAELEWFRNHPVPLIGLVILAAGALWKIRVFTPEECGHASWVFSGAAAFLIAFVLAST